jgi:hypothetical protein
MYRLSFLVLIIAAAAVTWSDSQAAGSFQKPAVVTAGMSTAASSVPTISPSDVVGGCGRGRVRDAQTHVCRGPADIR